MPLPILYAILPPLPADAALRRRAADAMLMPFFIIAADAFLPPPPLTDYAIDYGHFSFHYLRHYY